MLKFPLVPPNDLDVYDAKGEDAHPDGILLKHLPNGSDISLPQRHPTLSSDGQRSLLLDGGAESNYRLRFQDGHFRPGNLPRSGPGSR